MFANARALRSGMGRGETAKCPSLPPTWSMSTRVSTTTFVLEGFLNGPCCKQYTRYFNIPVLTHWEEPNPTKLGESVFKTHMMMMIIQRKLPCLGFFVQNRVCLGISLFRVF